MNMKSGNKQGKLKGALLAATAIVGTVGTFQANGQLTSSADYAALPPLIEAEATPRVMLVMSNDHQLFVKAYTDYSDLDGDGNLDITYNDAFDYYGYFNSNYCYDYSGGTFSPNGTVANGTHQCSGQWSGNFLNWATMTRIDVLRRVFYGGKRSTDAGGTTVLQRALIPNDSHAFVKTFTSPNIHLYTPISSGSESAISICNVTNYVSGTDQTNQLDVANNPPIFKLASGAWPLWSASEVVQCMWDEESGSRPDRPGRSGEGINVSGASNGQYTVRVATCVNGQDELDSDYCRAYTSGGSTVYKPAGLLQRHGEDGSLLFGLMTGSYINKDKGGVLRKNVEKFSGNDDPADDEVNLTNGEFNYMDGTGPAAGIIETLDAFRIAGWDYGSNRYFDCSTHSITVNTFKTSTASDRQCRDWGNPISEIYLEALRYFSGLTTASTEYNTDDSTHVPGLNPVSWVDPLDSNEPCSNCSIIVLSTGLNNFDADNFASITDLPGVSSASDVAAYMDDNTFGIGVLENLEGNQFITANVDGTTNNNICTTKTIGDFSNVVGLCPEMPQLEGSYYLAGLAYYAQTNDIRTGSGFDGIQNVDTYTLALAESLPSLEFETTSGNTISIVPACQANTSGGAALGDTGWNDCSLVDVTVVRQTATYTQILVAWEDSHWGNDYDMDGVASIEICTASGTTSAVRAACPLPSIINYTAAPPNFNGVASGQVQIRTSVPQAAAGNALRFGFILNGSVGADGSYVNLLRPGGQTVTRIVPSTSSRDVFWDSVRTYTADSDTGDLLENPLWYAAKYGNFDDSNLDDTPDSAAGDDVEWDTQDLAGNQTPDGIPDAFFPVSNPAQLVERMENVIEQISERVSAGTALAVSLDLVDGAGATYQAYYFPRYRPGGSQNSVSWVGGVRALFVDENLNFREDSNGNHTLDDADATLTFRYDAVANKTFIDRTSSGGTVELGLEFTEINALWDAKDVMGLATPFQILLQRNYSSPSVPGTGGSMRHVFTWIDRDEDGRVGSTNEIIDFTYPVMSLEENYRFLNVPTTDDALYLTAWLRGYELSGYRNRTIDWNGDGIARTWRYGDVVHSSPLVIGPPGEDYDRPDLYGDDTYDEFRIAHLDRRQVVYYGGNDGMLHAINAGFYDADARSFSTTGDDGETAHALGTELWAYVPYNLLPHLRWLAEANYPHVYYVDGEPRAYDVNIFTPDATHVNGWGTILVVGFRFGGGDITIDTEGDVDPSNDRTMRSAYVILDITDPEQPPTLLAEITDDQLGYTLGSPTVIKARRKDVNGVYSDGEDAWYLMFGSGPYGTDAANRAAALNHGISNQSAKVYAYSLDKLEFEAIGSGGSPALDTGIANSFTSSFTPADWVLDFIDDAAYFGLVEGSPATNPDSTSGQLMRAVFDFNLDALNPLVSVTTSRLMDPNKPFQGQPAVFIDYASATRYVVAGSGRLLTSADTKTNQANRFYGVVEEANADGSITGTRVLQGDMAVVNNVQVLSTDIVRKGGATPANINAGGSTHPISTYAELRDLAAANGGWRRNLGTFGTQQGRVFSKSLPVGLGVAVSRYYASGDVCSPDGTSDVIGVDFRTGTASKFAFFSQGADVLDGGGNIIGTALVDTTPTLVGATEISTTDGKYGVRDVGTTADENMAAQTGTGTSSMGTLGRLPLQVGRQSWRELPINN